jgi:acylphosphatase
MSSAGRAFHAIVSGRVQGVGFRFFAIREGRALGIRGTVANRPDGSVEVVAEGDAARLAALLAWLQKGPPGARVREVQVQWIAPSDTYTDFDVAF